MIIPSFMLDRVMREVESKEKKIYYEIALQLWDIAGISPDYDNALMDIIGEEAYKKVMTMQNDYNNMNKALEKSEISVIKKSRSD